MLEVGDLVKTTGDSWADRYRDRVFLVLEFIEYSEFGNKWLLLDHISGGKLIAYDEEIEKIAE